MGSATTDQHLCLAFAFWNGQDPILKERIFGLTSNEGNHGEDAKEHWWYLDSTPTHSWMRWRYVYPQARLPLRGPRRARTPAAGSASPSTSCSTPGASTTTATGTSRSTTRRPGRTTSACACAIRNAGPDAAELHLLPTLWFRNRWSWGDGREAPVDPRGRAARSWRTTTTLTMTLTRRRASPRRCSATTRRTRGASGASPPRPTRRTASTTTSWPARRPSIPRRTGTKAALWYRLRGRRRRDGRGAAAADAASRGVGKGWESTLRARAAEADAFYAALAPAATPDEHDVMRQAFGGMLWSKQFYHYDVDRWLRRGSRPACAAGRAPRRAATRHGATSTTATSSRCRTSGSTPGTRRGTWPSTASRSRTSTPSSPRSSCGSSPASGTCTPTASCRRTSGTSATSTRRSTRWRRSPCSELDGARDHEWLGRIFHKLLLGFTWWANVKDPEGNLLFGGGFLGMDNVGPFDRSAPLPDGLVLEQADGTGWMAHLLPEHARDRDRPGRPRTRPTRTSR